MPRTILALLLAASGAGAHAQGLPAPPPDAAPPAALPEARAQEPAPAPVAKRAEPGGALPRGAILEEVAGVVREVDRESQRFAVDSGSARVTLSLDRNTMVYTPAGLGTVLDVVPGAQIRAGRNADFLAYWVQIRAPAGSAPPPPGQGTGPAGGAAAPATEAGAPPAPGAPSGPGPGSPAGTPGSPGSPDGQ